MQDWLKQNATTIVFVIAGLIGAWTMLNFRVNMIEANVKQIEAEIDRYPSQDWFELRFQQIDTRFDTIEEKIK